MCSYFDNEDNVVQGSDSVDSFSQVTAILDSTLNTKVYVVFSLLFSCCMSYSYIPTMYVCAYF